jgi:myotubularin-related protein 5/13
MDCGNSYHEKCAENVPKNCTKYKTVEGSQSTMSRNQGDNVSVVSSNATTGQTSNDIYRTFDSNVPENRTHEG